MKNVAEFKRGLKVGRKIHTIFHKEFSHRDEKGKVVYKDKDMGIREVSIVQSNSFAMKTTRSDGSTVNSWCNYPKASESLFNDGAVTILESEGDRKPVLTYKFVD